MSHIQFEKLLGQSIEVVSEITESNFIRIENPKLKTRLYGSKDYITKNFYGIIIYHITLVVNEENIVQSITVHFRKVIDRPFFDLFVEKYGKPNNIQIIENIQLESESVIKDDNGKAIETLRKGSFDLIEGSFDEKPLYIIWKKENFEIKAFLRHEQNISELTFSKINKKG